MSAPYERSLEIFVELVPDGELTPKMWAMELGDKMSVRPRAKGIFVQDKKKHHHFMLSTVTGVAPSVSMVRQYLHEGKDDGHVFYIMYGASYVDELTYDSEFIQMMEKHPDIVKSMTGLRQVLFLFDNNGSQIVFYQPNNAEV